jgi:hypothetical protein
MELPDLTIGICTFKRPWYAVHCINGFIHRMNYDGKKKFLIADGGSPEEDLHYYGKVLKDCDWQLAVTDNLSSMVNSCARNSGELFIVCVDDFVVMDPFDITPDVKFLLANEDVGQIRMGRLAFWGSGGKGPETYAELRELGGYHWWVLDKKRTTDSYMCSIGTHLYHRRFWDRYGDLQPCTPNIPGEAELLGNERFRAIDGPTVAVPMRFGEDCRERKEFIWHMGCWRSDEYAETAGTRF